PRAAAGRGRRTRQPHPGTTFPATSIRRRPVGGPPHPRNHRPLTGRGNRTAGPACAGPAVAECVSPAGPDQPMLNGWPHSVTEEVTLSVSTLTRTKARAWA